MNTQPIDPRALKAVEALDHAGKLAHWPETETKKQEAARIIQSHFAETPSMADELAEALRDLTKIGTPQLGTEKLKAIDILARYDAQKGQS